jgi:hypothetical protein
MAGRSPLPLLMSLMAGSAAAGDGIDGRFGRTEVRYVATKPVVFHNGQKAFAIDDADDAAILRLIPEATKDFVLVRSWQPALKCPAAFHLLSIQPKAPLQVSPPFGACTEIAGISFAGQSPVVHLRQPGVGKIEQITWKDGKMYELAAVSQACFAKHEQANEKSSRQLAALIAAGDGRLQFHSAPDERCEIAGTFVVPGDRLEASRVHGRYTLVFYQHPKAARVAVGWVDSSRLKPAN